jgi:hypothetical protein
MSVIGATNCDLFPFTPGIHKFKKILSHLKIRGTRLMTKSTFHSQDSEDAQNPAPQHKIL